MASFVSLEHYAKRVRLRLTVAAEVIAQIGVLQDLVGGAGKATFAQKALLILIKENAQQGITVP